MKMLFAMVGSVLVAAFFLIVLASIDDAAKRAIYGDEYVDQQGINARKQLDYQTMIINQRDADDAALEAAEAQAKADQARRELNNEGKQ